MQSCTVCICVYVHICVSMFYVYKWYIYVMCLHTNMHVYMHAQYTYICICNFFLLTISKQPGFHFSCVHCKQTRLSKVCSIWAKRRRKTSWLRALRYLLYPLSFTVWERWSSGDFFRISTTGILKETAYVIVGNDWMFLSPVSSDLSPAEPYGPRTQVYALTLHYYVPGGC